jgi:hypothetical protein
MKRIVVTIALLCATVAVSAQTTVDKRELKNQHLRELLVLLNEERTVRSSVHQNLAQVAESLKKNFEPSSEDLPEREVAAERAAYEKEVAEFAQRYEEIFLQKLNYKQFEEENILPLYAKYFSDDEVLALKTFYASPAGKKSLEILPELLADTMRLASEKLAPIAAEAATDIEAEDAKKNPWKGTLKDIRTVATALEAYATDEEEYPADSSYDSLKTLLEPTYVKVLPQKDGWGNSFVVVVSSDRQHYRIVSPGADGTFEWDSKTIRPIAPDASEKLTEHLEDDIVYGDGQFIQVPRISKRSHM